MEFWIFFTRRIHRIKYLKEGTTEMALYLHEISHLRWAPTWRRLICIYVWRQLQTENIVADEWNKRRRKSGSGCKPNLVPFTIRSILPSSRRAWGLRARLAFVSFDSANFSLISIRVAFLQSAPTLVVESKTESLANISVTSGSAISLITWKWCDMTSFYPGHQEINPTSFKSSTCS